MALQLMFQNNQNGNNLQRRDRIFRDRTNPLEMYDDIEMVRRYRLPREQILNLIDLLAPELDPPTDRSKSISATLQVFTALRYFATGSFQQVIGDTNGVSQPSVSRAVAKVSRVLSAKVGDFIKFPTTQQDQMVIKRGFEVEFGMPNTLGCVDDTLIAIKAPSEREDAYVCRKGFHAINVQGVCDHTKKLTNIVVQYPGSTHDAYIWGNSGLKTWFENQNYVGHLLGDQAYPLKPYLLTPVRNPTSQQERAYNVVHKRARQRIEDTFGRWKNRWMCIHKWGRYNCYV